MMNGHYKNGINHSNSNGSGIETSENKEFIYLKRLYSLILRFKWLIIVSVILFTSGAYYLAFYHLLPQYKSAAVVTIDAGNNNPGANFNVANALIPDRYVMGKSIEADIQFLTSRDLLNKVASQLVNLRDEEDLSKFPILWSNFPEDSSAASVDAVTGRLGSGISIGQSPKSEEILNVSFTGYSPQEASRITNLYLNVALEISKQDRRSTAKSAREFLKREKERVKDQLNQAEDRLSRFMNQEDLISFEAQAGNLVNSYSNLQDQRQKIEVDIQGIVTNINNLENQIESIKPGLSDQFSQAIGPTIRNLQNRLAELQTQRFVIISNNPHLKDNPTSEPSIRKIDKQSEEIKVEIRELTNQMFDTDGEMLRGTEENIAQEIQAAQRQITELRIQKNQLEAQARILDNRIQEVRLFLDKVPGNRVQLARIERDITQFEQLYLALSERETEIALTEETIGSMGVIMEYARPSQTPVSPKKPLILVLGFWIGAAFPIGLLFLHDITSSKIRGIDDLKEKKYPILSVIYDHDKLNRKKLAKTLPANGQKVPDSLTFVKYSDTPDAESYRRLVNNLLFSDPDNAPKTILVTSSVQGEGKSTVSVNLASALAETGKRVLIVDCDLRRPNVHRFFNKSAKPGIMQILFEDKEYQYKEFVQKTVVPGLYMIPSGGVAPNPRAITSSDKFRDLIMKLKDMVDFVILDTPPYGVISDVGPLLKLSDGVLLTVRFNQTKNAQLNYAIEQLNKSSANVLGFVMNKYDSKKSVDDQDTKNLYTNLYSNYYSYHKKSKELTT
jgi:capsular exopolysaccharide synthesis family protein